jgi:hypothetical protein
MNPAGDASGAENTPQSGSSVGFVLVKIQGTISGLTLGENPCIQERRTGVPLQLVGPWRPCPNRFQNRLLDIAQ